MKFSLKHFLLKNWADLFSLEKEPCDKIFLFVILLEILQKKTPYNDDPVFSFLGNFVLLPNWWSVHSQGYLAMSWL
jgi:hypothetical protein